MYVKDLEKTSGLLREQILFLQQRKLLGYL